MPTKSASKTITRDPQWLSPAIHPGEILLEEFLKPLGLAQVEAAQFWMRLQADWDLHEAINAEKAS